MYTGHRHTYLSLDSSHTIYGIDKTIADVKLHTYNMSLKTFASSKQHISFISDKRKIFSVVPVNENYEYTELIFQICDIFRS